MRQFTKLSFVVTAIAIVSGAKLHQDNIALESINSHGRIVAPPNFPPTNGHVQSRRIPGRHGRIFEPIHQDDQPYWWAGEDNPFNQVVCKSGDPNCRSANINQFGVAHPNVRPQFHSAPTINTQYSATTFQKTPQMGMPQVITSSKPFRPRPPVKSSQVIALENENLQLKEQLRLGQLQMQQQKIDYKRELEKQIMNFLKRRSSRNNNNQPMSQVSHQDKIDQLMGPIGMCPSRFICVHWQLCSQGVLINDGSGIIDNTISSIPLQVSSSYESCGGDMICCGIQDKGFPSFGFVKPQILNKFENDPHPQIQHDFISGTLSNIPTFESPHVESVFEKPDQSIAHPGIAPPSLIIEELPDAHGNLDHTFDNGLPPLPIVASFESPQNDPDFISQVSPQVIDYETPLLDDRFIPEPILSAAEIGSPHSDHDLTSDELPDIHSIGRPQISHHDVESETVPLTLSETHRTDDGISTSNIESGVAPDVEHSEVTPLHSLPNVPSIESLQNDPGVILEVLPQFSDFEDYLVNDGFIPESVPNAADIGSLHSDHDLTSDGLPDTHSIGRPQIDHDVASELVPSTLSETHRIDDAISTLNIEGGAAPNDEHSEVTPLHPLPDVPSIESLQNDPGVLSEVSPQVIDFKTPLVDDEYIPESLLSSTEIGSPLSDHDPTSDGLPDIQSIDSPQINHDMESETVPLTLSEIQRTDDEISTLNIEGGIAPNDKHSDVTPLHSIPIVPIIESPQIDPDFTSKVSPQVIDLENPMMDGGFTPDTAQSAAEIESPHSDHDLTSGGLPDIHGIDSPQINHVVESERVPLILSDTHRTVDGISTFNIDSEVAPNDEHSEVTPLHSIGIKLPLHTGDGSHGNDNTQRTGPQMSHQVPHLTNSGDEFSLNVPSIDQDPSQPGMESNHLVSDHRGDHGAPVALPSPGIPLKLRPHHPEDYDPTKLTSSIIPDDALINSEDSIFIPSDPQVLLNRDDPNIVNIDDGEERQSIIPSLKQQFTHMKKPSLSDPPSGSKFENQHLDSNNPQFNIHDIPQDQHLPNRHVEQVPQHTAMKEHLEFIQNNPILKPFIKNHADQIKQTNMAVPQADLTSEISSNQGQVSHVKKMPFNPLVSTDHQAGDSRPESSLFSVLLMGFDFAPPHHEEFQPTKTAIYPNEIPVIDQGVGQSSFRPEESIKNIFGLLTKIFEVDNHFTSDAIPNQVHDNSIIEGLKGQPSLLLLLFSPRTCNCGQPTLHSTNGFNTPIKQMPELPIRDQPDETRPHFNNNIQHHPRPQNNLNSEISSSHDQVAPLKNMPLNPLFNDHQADMPRRKTHPTDQTDDSLIMPKMGHGPGKFVHDLINENQNQPRPHSDLNSEISLSQNHATSIKNTPVNPLLTDH